jgi:hypothetical protein
MVYTGKIIEKVGFTNKLMKKHLEGNTSPMISGRNIKLGNCSH